MSKLQKKETRCNWCGDDVLYQKYHDEEWGRPCFDEKTLFEFITLEGAQAGLSWITVLRRREAYNKAFVDHDIEKIAHFTEKKILALKEDASIIRHEGKIRATVGNAQAAIKLCEEKGSLSNYFWAFVDGAPIANTFENLKEVPARTDLSDLISKDMKKRGFKFFGTTICYAYLQAMGLVNDHLVNCFAHEECSMLGHKLR